MTYGGIRSARSPMWSRRSGRAGDDERQRPVQDPGERVGERAFGVGDRRAVLDMVRRRRKPVAAARQTITRAPSPTGGPGAEFGQPRVKGAAQGEDRLVVERGGAVGGRAGAGAAAADGFHQRDRSDFRDDLDPVNNIVARSAPILDSQVNSRDAIGQWAADLNVIGAQAASRTRRCAAGSSGPRPPPISSTRCAACAGLAAADLANLQIVVDMLKRYHKGVEQALVYFPGSVAASRDSILPGEGILRFALGPIFAAIGAGGAPPHSAFPVPPVPGPTSTCRPVLNGSCRRRITVSGERHNSTRSHRRVLQGPKTI